ncbi:MAG: GAF domain-containing protein [Deltaproteobacteria bacterium]|nr:GAF domain-containing protein [Deltaproteobacteria bacterium]MBN2672951.1 GAF domain-containing protein [Deltaproteobacteria bacterium]
MEWLLNMPGNGQDILDAQVTVKAENWFAALRAGLKRYGLAPVSNVRCAPSTDGALEVRDFVSGRVFHIHPVSTDAGNSAPNATVELFGGRDVAADEGGVSYCERRICVPAQLTVAQCESIGKDVLRAHVKPTTDGQLVVSVQVYDHRFDDHPRRPAIVRLAWQQWRPDVLKVDYPAGGRMSESPEEADFFQASSETFETTSKVDAFDMSRLCVLPSRQTGEGISVSGKEASSSVSQLEASEIVRPAARKADPARMERKRAARQRVIEGVDDGVMWAFEQMQHLYRKKEHDSAATFVCDTLLKAAPSEACAVLLTTPGKSELYVAAQTGFDDTWVKRVRVPMLGGIVGAALKSGAVMNVSDPADERFDARVDLRAPFEVDTVLVVPIAFEGHVFGVALLYNRLDDALFSQEDANVASYVAGVFAEYIQVSLPSREAEFQDKEFDGLRRPVKVFGPSSANAKKMMKKKPRSKKTMSNGPRRSAPAGKENEAAAAKKKRITEQGHAPDVNDVKLKRTKKSSHPQPNAPKAKRAAAQKKR